MKKIALVDDDTDILEILETFLSEDLDNTEHQYIPFNDPTQVFANKDFMDFDIIISDLQMPQMSGLELYKKLRELGYANSFIFVTGFAGNIHGDLLHYDNCFILSKPVNFAQLVSIVKGSLELQSKVLNLQQKLLDRLAKETDFNKASEDYKVMTRLINQTKLRERLKLKVS